MRIYYTLTYRRGRDALHTPTQAGTLEEAKKEAVLLAQIHAPAREHLRELYKKYSLLRIQKRMRGIHSVTLKVYPFGVDTRKEKAISTYIVYIPQDKEKEFTIQEHKETPIDGIRGIMYDMLPHIT
jgi:hypothetical protein